MAYFHFFSSFFYSFFFFLFLILSYSIRFTVNFYKSTPPTILRIDLRGRFAPGPWWDNTARHHGRPRGMTPPARFSRRMHTHCSGRGKDEDFISCLCSFLSRALFLSLCQRDWSGVRTAMHYKEGLARFALLLAPSLAEAWVASFWSHACTGSSSPRKCPFALD